MCVFGQTKNQLKKTRLGVIMKIATHKSQKTKEKLQNRQKDLSELSWHCYLEFY